MGGQTSECILQDVQIGVNTTRTTESHILILILTMLNASGAAGQAPESGWEVRPKVVVAINLVPRLRLETWGERQDGTNFSFRRWRTGALLSERLKPLLTTRRQDIDPDNNHFLVLAAGYEYLHTVQNGGTKNENRV